MKTITRDQLDAICNNGRPIDSKGGFPAVVLHPDGTITKLWARKKGFFSSATLHPYSGRFVSNAAKLSALGIKVPEIIDHARLENSHVRLVTYRGLSGDSIRELLETAPDQVDMEALCRYIDHLHGKGISFGGMHLGNIIKMPDGYGLIDFTDVRFYGKSLTPQKRAANLRTPLRYQEDIDRIQKAGLPELVDSYLTVADLTDSEKVEVRKLLGR
ncbi:toluene tolerance protein [Oceaniferula spumae]|uniref:Toluene tolerance protein n=1 Tax=Oceaniferula spumae TaxID=2979115 RepID=A0AAT9FQP2_9BACT